MKKKYIIVGDNNFWYSTTGEITELELVDEFKDVQVEIQNGSYTDTGYGNPTMLFAYEAKVAIAFAL